MAVRVGFPVVVKAVGGGGGIGMQVVREEAGLERALKSCADRGKASFADARVYLERYVGEPRHIEVQVFCDAHGNAYALGERECSLQRRHQKILEESPSPASFFAGEAGEGRRQALFAAALRVVNHVGYRGAGTCEFIADEKGELYFLEVNARLQVEHPVTEMVTGLDLVELQLRVAAGEALPDLSRLVPRGHAIEVRVYAEDPSKGFIPKPGSIDTLIWAGGARGSAVPLVAHRVGGARGEQGHPLLRPYDRQSRRLGRHARGRRHGARRRAGRHHHRPLRHQPRIPAQDPGQRGVHLRKIHHGLRGAPREAVVSLTSGGFAAGKGGARPLLPSSLFAIEGDDVVGGEVGDGGFERLQYLGCRSYDHDGEVPCADP